MLLKKRNDAQLTWKGVWTPLGGVLFSLMLTAVAVKPASAQTAWVPLINETFETGTANVSTTPASQLAPGTTDYTAVTTVGGTSDGSYSITKNPDFNDDFGAGFNNQWQHAGDHTTGSEYMALFNANPARRGEAAGTYYLYTNSSFDVAGATYRMSYWAANILRFNAAISQFDAFIGLSVRDQPNGTGILYGSEPNSAVALPRATGNQNNLPWVRRNAQFTLPLTYAGTAIYFNFYNSASILVTASGNDLAIDDLLIEMAVATVSGRIYLDNNQDGVYNPGAGDAAPAAPLPYVAALSSSNKVYAFTQVAADGTYTLPGVVWSASDIGQKLIA